jgi:glycosyltransferase involved in cell wall biosynthesis
LSIETEEKKRIVLLENTFYTVLSLRMELMNYLVSNGYEITVISTGPKEDLEKLEARGYKSYDVGSVVMNPLKAFSYIIQLSRKIKEIAPLAVISFTIRPNIFGSLVVRYLKVPILCNVTGTGPLTQDQSMLYRVIRLLYKFAFLKSKKVFFQNEEDMNFFLNNKFVRSTQAILLPGSGVNTDNYSPREKRSTNFSFLMISRLIKDKGVLEYIEAARILKSSHPEIEFKLLGPFWTQSIGKNTIKKTEVESWVASGLISYLGYSLDIRPVIQEASCVVLPSYREGCSNVLMQSASMSKPLITTDVTGCQNLVEDERTGLICQVRNADDLAEKMRKMYQLTESEQLEMGRKGREKMIREYQKRIVLEAYKSELDRL